MWMSHSLTKKKTKKQKFESFTIKEKKEEEERQLLNCKYKLFLTFCYGCVVHMAKFQD